MLKLLIKSSNSLRISCFNKNLSVNSYSRVLRFSTVTSTKPNNGPKTTSQVTSDSDEDEFRPVYRNSKMKFIAVLNKLTPHFFKASLITLPPVSGILYWFEFLDNQSLIGFYLVAVAFILPVQAFSFGTQRLIGFVYLNKENDQVKISYISYFGKREDIILPIESIMSFSDSPVSPTDFLYKKVRTFDTDTVYRIDIKFGEVLDEDGFKLVFGDYKK
ncbi:hypothetical protein LSTR_LSTR012288 [Laodelphax striatellus]|uniref:Transmembrane protein 186 n=1 Tax=Laodelphax striatellus TaxID=195883 RepID=A0A482X8Y5_LAOST|nr:hypothetical protein LSTR_LSTR012288 [Laodelphax striatellus]